MKKLIGLFLALFMLFSCKTYKMSENDLKWQPYKKGDVLIFESNKGEIDTVVIKSIETYINPDDPLAVFPNKLQSLFVISERSILEMSAGEKGTYINFTMHLGNNKLKYPNTLRSITEMDEAKKDKNNRYVIEANEYYDNMKDRPFDLRYIYWSKEYGYLGLEFKDNYVWTLMSFIRDGKRFCE